MPFRVQTAEAAGSGYSDYQFSNIVVNNSVQVAPSLDGPWEDKNFIRVSKNSSKFYVKVKVTLASLKPEDGPAKDSLAINQDKIVIPGWSNFNKTITNVGASFVSKMTPEQANEIAKRVAAGEKVGKGGIEVPCYLDSTASGGTILTTVVVVGAIAAVGAATGGLAVAGAGALFNAGVGGMAALSIGAASSAGVATGGAVIGGGLAAGSLAINPVSGNQYVKCDSPVRPAPQNKNAVKVGDALFEYVQEVTSANYQSALGMSASATKDPNAVNEFYVVPDFYFSVWNGLRSGDDAFMSSIGAGKSVYAQIYDTQAEVDQHKNDAAPAGVPNNGVNTGSGNNVNNTSDPVINFINQIIGTIIGWIQYLIFQIFTKLVSPLLVALLSIRTYTDAFAAVIYPGWEVVRNLCNILFIISLIAIAMGTLFRIESYQYKHMLVQLIIAALLVNFSLVMAQAVLGLADTMQNQFLPNNSNVVNALAKILIVDTKTAFNQMASSGDAGYFALTVTPFFNLALSIGSFLVFVAIMGFLLVRIVALWVLLMISPIAYAAGALPTTAHYRSEWWTNFIKYAFFTPIMAFFLNIVAVIGTAQQNNPILRQAVNGQNSLGSSSTISGFVVTIGSNLLLLLMLIAALKVAEQFGVMGADVASKVVKGGMMAPLGGIAFAGKRAGGYLARRYNEITSELVTDKHGLTANLKKGAFAVLNPVNFFKGWEERAHEKKEWAQEMAKGAGQMVASELSTGGRERINYKELALQKIQSKIAGKLRESLGDDPGRAPSMDLQRRINKVKGFEGRILRGALAKLTGDQGWSDDTNEVASDTEHDRHYWMEQLKKRGTNDAGIDLFKQACITYDDQGFETMQWVYQGLDLNMLARLRADKENKIQKERDEHDPHKFADKEYQKFIEKNQLALMNVASLTNGAKRVGHYEQMFMAKKDDKSGLFIPLVDSAWAKEQFEADPENFDASKAMRTSEIIGEVNKIGIRPFWQNTAWHTLLRKVKKDKNGKALSIADWDKDGEWGVGSMGDNGDNLSLMQKYIWKKTMAGKKYASQAGHAQARIVGYIVGKCFDSKGKLKPEMAQEYKEMYEVNPDLTKILTFVQLTGNPPIEKEGMDQAQIDAQLPDLFVRHGNTSPAYMHSPTPPRPPPTP